MLIKEESLTELVKASSISLLIMLLAFFINLGANLLMARWLGVVVFGDLGAAINSLQLTSFIVLMGMDLAVVRFVPEYISTSNWSAASGYLKHNFEMLIRIGIIVFVVGLVTAVVLYVLDKQRMFIFEESHPAFLFLWAIPIVAYNTYLAKLLSTTRQIYTSMVSFTIAMPVLLILILSIEKYFTHQVTVNQAISAFIFSLFLIVIWQLVVSYSSLPVKILRSKGHFKSKKWSGVAFQLFFTSFLTTNLYFLMVVVSEIFDPSEANTGILFAVLSIATLLLLLSSGIVTVLSPLISPVIQKKDTVRLQKLVNIGNLAMFVSALIVLLIVFFWGKTILSYFGPAFVLGYPSLVLFVAMSTLMFLTGMSIPLLQFSGHEKLIAKVNIVGTIMLIVLAAFMSRHYGLMGTVVATCIVQAMLLLCCSYWVRKLLGIKPFILF